MERVCYFQTKSEMKSCIPKPYERAEEPDVEQSAVLKTTVNESAITPLAELGITDDGNAFSYLLAAAQAVDNMEASERKLKGEARASLSPGRRELKSGETSSNVHMLNGESFKEKEKQSVTCRSPVPSQIRVIKCVTSPSQMDAWCNICNCTVNRNEVGYGMDWPRSCLQK